MERPILETLIQLAYILAAVLFVVGLHRMNSPATARNGNVISAIGMAIAVGAAGVDIATRPAGEVQGLAWPIIGLGVLIGGGLGLYTARVVKMTAMPQLVSLFNAVGGGAAALVAIDEYTNFVQHGEDIALQASVATVLGVVIGCVTFSGSLIASGKLQGVVPGRPVTFNRSQLVTAALAVAAVVFTLLIILADADVVGLPAGLTLLLLALVVAAALVFGVTMVLPIGGADMPVVISLLNSFTGTAAAMAGFVINNPVLIIAGALVGAAGAILTKLMADAMNRSIVSILVGGFGTGDAAAGAAGAGATGSVREVTADDVAIQLAYAQSVIVVPGYGLAVAQAQHNVRELAELLEERGVDVKYAIHPVAGRMPGHMNVLLAEANVPYPQLKEMEEINPDFGRADVALVVGANDVTNPAARTNPSSPIYGMPILNVDEAKSVVVIKRSMRPGYAGIDNELYLNPRTGMLFGDAKDALASLISAVKAV